MQSLEKDYTFQDENIDLKEYLYTIFKRRWILFSIISIFMVIDLIYTFKQTPIYRATSLALIEKPSYASQYTSGAKEVVTPEIRDRDYYSTQYEIIKSRMLAKRVVKSLNLGSMEGFSGESPESTFQGMISVEPVKNTRLVSVSVDYKDPIMATKMVNTLVALYIGQNIENMLFMSKEILKAFPEDAKEIERNTIYGQLKDISKEEAVESLPSIVNNNILQQLKTEKIGVETELANLSRRYKENHPKMVALNTKLKFINDKIELETGRILSSLRADIAGRLQVNNIRIIDYAQVPRSPIKPQKAKNILLGLFFSTFLGIGIIFLMEHLDDSVKNQEDVESRLGIPYLGDFPILKTILPSLKFIPHKLDEIDKNVDASEAIRNIRTNIIFSVPKDSLKNVLITSTLPQEGKSFLSSYIAFSFAKNGFKTLILDADIRKPRMHKFFEIERAPGLVNLLVESVPLEAAIKKTPYDNLYVLPSGSKTPNPQELLSSVKLDELIQKLSGSFEKIIIDTPPSFNIADALVLSRLSDMVIFVTKSGTVSKDALIKIKDKFSATGSRIAGTIINFSEMEKNSYYKYRYYHKYYKDYYSSDEDELEATLKKDSANFVK